MLYPFEEAAEKVEILRADGAKLEGWINRSSNDIVFIDKPGQKDSRDSQWHASYRAFSDQPCGREGCSGRASKHRTVCDPCFARASEDKWTELLAKAVDWDGSWPICEWDGDGFFFDESQLWCHVEEMLEENPGWQLEDLRVSPCDPDNGPSFEMSELLQDHLPDDPDYFRYDFATIDKVVNDWIKENAPFSWHGQTRAIRPESLRPLLAGLFNR